MSAHDSEIAPMSHSDKDGESPDPNVVAKVLVGQHLDVVRGPEGKQGPVGKAGKDGESPSADDVAAILMNKHREKLIQYIEKLTQPSVLRPKPRSGNVNPESR